MKNLKNLAVSALIISCVLVLNVSADVKLPAIFGDHMVLQQKSHVTVWGWADPGEKVTVKGSWQWTGKNDRADADGKWSVKIKTPKAKAGKALTLTVKGNNEIVLNDILLGEVWICSGQSNMQWSMARLGTDTVKQDIANAADSQIRLFTVERTFSTTPKDDCKGRWQVCSPETVAPFSATGYYFGRGLRKKIDVPVGLISTNWGGTLAEAWTSKETLADFPQFKEQLEMIDNPEQSEAARKEKFIQQLKAWDAKVAKTDIGIQQQWFQSKFDDSGWNEMTLPRVWAGTDLAGIDGAVWFRRETNLPPSWTKADLQLHLGAIDDIASVWFNGTPLGTTGGWNQKRVYTIPKSILRKGRNTIAVRVIDTAGEGGFSSAKDDMRIGPAGADVKTCSTLAGTWKYKLSHQGTVAALPAQRPQIHQNTPTTLYNGMIAPLLPFRIAGAIWYQGESNCYDPIGYRTLFPAMITDWRQKWNQGDFPFYYVQIAPFQYQPDSRRSQAVREAQLMTLDTVDNVGMATITDIGEQRDIHPVYKHDVGDRLARWALAKTYKQKDIVYSGPLYKDMTVEGSKIRVSFDYADGGLVAADSGLTDFEIAGADNKFVPAKAVIDGKTLVISSESVKEPVAARYGWSNWFMASLFNKEGLPASSFRTDDWPLE